MINLAISDIDPNVHYTKSELRSRFGIGNSLYRRLITNGLRVQYLGRESVVSGESLKKAILASIVDCKWPSGKPRPPQNALDANAELFVRMNK